MDLERLIVKLTADVGQYNRAMDGAEYRISRFARGMGPLGQMIDVPFLAAAGAIAAVGAAMGVAAVEAVRYAADFERATVAMEVMTGSAAVAKDMMSQLVQLGIETPFKTKELMNAAQILKSYNVDNEDLIDTLKVLGDVAMGDAERLNRIALAFGQVKGAGRLMGQELRQFVNAGAISVQDLAKVLNVHPSRVKSLVEEAKVSFADVTKAFNLVTGPGGRFFEMSDRVNKTVFGQWNAMVETFQLALRRIGEGFFKAFGIQDLLHEWSQGLRTGEGQFNQFFEDLRSNFNDLVKLIKTAVYWIEKAWNGIKEWVKENEDLLKSIGRVLAVVGSVLAITWLLVQAWGVLSTVVALAFSPLGVALIALGGIAALLEHIGDLQDVGSGFDRLMKHWTDGFKGLAGAFRDAMVAEDWDLVGRIIGKGLELAVKGFVVTLKFELIGAAAAMGARLVTEFDRAGKYISAFWQLTKDRFDPNMTHEEASAKWLAANRKADEEAITSMKDKLAVIDKRKQQEIEEAMRPIQGDINRLRVEAGEKRRTKEEADALKKADAVGLEIVRMIDRLVEERNEVLDIGEFRVQKGELKREEMDALIPQIGSEYLHRIIGNMGVLLVRDFLRRGVQGGAVAGAENMFGNQAPVPFGFRPETTAYVNRLTHEMERGQWAGVATNKFELFNKNLDIINEAATGPKLTPDNMKTFGNWMSFFASGRFGDLAVQLGSKGVQLAPLIDEKTRDFAMFEEFTNLRKVIPKEERLPGALMMGSTEAQDAVNKAILAQKTAAEEVRDLMIEAAEYSKQQSEYQAAIVAELKKLNGNVEEFGGGGGDF